MNKLAALVGDRIGTRTQYQNIAEATYGSKSSENDRSNEIEPILSPSPRHSINNNNGSDGDVKSDESGTNRSFLGLLLGNATGLSIVAIFTVAVAALAIAGDRASRIAVEGEQVDQLSGGEAETANIDYRPCQIYAGDDTNSGGVKGGRGGKDGVPMVLETSLAEPSVHWGQIPCLVHSHRFDRRMFKKENDVLTAQEEGHSRYGMASAEIRIDSSKVSHPEREPIMGFGGAFTEASALNLGTLGGDGQDAILELLFGRDGLGYSLGRVPINSCDFSEESYNFDNVDGDFDLKHFDGNVKHDVNSGLVDFMVRADKIARASWGDDGGDSGVKILASPWSPPAWMKAPTDEDSNGATHAENMTGSALPNCLKDGTGPDSKYAKSWALYFDKFITAYKALGVNMFAVTVQNEPEFPAPWEACAYNPWNQGAFIANHLGPQLRKSHPDVKIFMFDHNKDHIPLWADIILNQSNPASHYVDGSAVHWYAGGMDRLLDGAVGQPNMHRLVSHLKKSHVRPDHLILGSEACHCPTTGYAGGDINIAWTRAERYAHTILSDLAAGSNGWVEWNLVLDSIGGPNHLTNLCDAPLLAVPHRVNGANASGGLPDFEHTITPFGPVVGDKQTREELNELGIPAEYLDVGVVVQPMYYYMGHISRHVRPGSRAVNAIVDKAIEGLTSRVFRHTGNNGRITAGGGINNLARIGIELTLWPCEGSTRQEWIMDEMGRLKVFGHDWLGIPTTSCVGKMPDPSFGGLLLVECIEEAASFQMKSILDHSDERNGSFVNFALTNSTDNEGFNCLVLNPLENDGGAYGPRGGSQVTVGNCSDSSAAWKFNETTNELISEHFDVGDVCLTTGWPFLQVGAFLSPTKKTTVIILNEAGESANYVIRERETVILTNKIPPHSIQTVLL